MKGIAMIIRKPECFDGFACIGGKCTDTCCAGWEIEVDDQSAERYQEMKGPLGERIRKHLVIGKEENYFPLKAGKCPFLNTDGLCDLISEAGDGILCDICREHPRFYNWYGRTTEKGLGLCCEEAERLMFEETEPLRFCTEEFAEEDFVSEKEISEEEDFFQSFFAAREEAFSLIQGRERELPVRLILLERFAEKMQEVLDTDEESLEGRCREWREKILPEEEKAVRSFLSVGKDSEKRYGSTSKNSAVQYGNISADTGERQKREGEDVENRQEEKQRNYRDCENTVGHLEESMRDLLRLYASMEVLYPSWKRLLKDLLADEKRISRTAASAGAFKKAFPETEIDYEHLTVYFLYRYFMESSFDMDLLSKVRFAIASILLIRILEIDCWLTLGERSEESRNRIVRKYSKEIEYCPENVERLLKETWDSEMLQKESLEKMIRIL